MKIGYFYPGIDTHKRGKKTFPTPNLKYVVSGKRYVHKAKIIKDQKKDKALHPVLSYS